MEKRKHEKKIIPRNVLTSKEAMAEVGWGPSKFWDLVNTGQIKGYKDGQWRFERTEIEKYKKRRTAS